MYTRLTADIKRTAVCVSYRLHKATYMPTTLIGSNVNVSKLNITDLQVIYCYTCICPLPPMQYKRYFFNR